MRKFILFIFFIFHFLALSSPSHLEFSFDHFISPPYDKELQSQNYVSLETKQDWKISLGSFDLHSQMIMDLRSRMIRDWSDQQVVKEHLSSSMLYYGVPEIYISYLYRFKGDYLLDIESLNVSIGRKIHSWSRADEYWEFGLWNSLNRWNPLHPTSNGLIGTFLNLKAKNWSLDMLVGGLFLPGSQTKATLKDGRVSSSSRWFTGLPHKINILDRSVLDIKYFIKLPFLLDLFFQQSYIASYKMWTKHQQKLWWMKWVLGYKPINDVFMLTNTHNILEIKEEGTRISKGVTFAPVKHMILSGEWGLDYDNFSTVFSFGNTYVKEGKAPKGWDFLHDKGYFTYLSALAKYEFFDKNHIQISYLNSWFEGHQKKEEAYNKIKKPPFISGRYKVLHGLGLDIHLEYLGQLNLKRELDIKYKYSIPNDGGLLSVQGIYQIHSQTYLSVTADILGTKNKQAGGFLNNFYANDYFGVGLGYVF